MVEIGDRVVLRYRLPPGSSHPMTDVLGELQGRDPVAVRTDEGRVVSIAIADVVALKTIPPRPVTSRKHRSP